MNTTEIIEIASKETGITIEQCSKVFEILSNTIKSELHRGNIVKLRNIGSLTLTKKHNVEFKGFGKKYMKDMQISIKFKASKNLTTNNSFGELLNAIENE